MLVYSRLKAFEGAITVTPDDLPESFASQEFPTFGFVSDADPDFFRILTTTQGMWDALQGASKGMGGRRERVKPADFLDIVMDIPPLAVQERIVEIVSVVDDQIAALEVEADSLLTVRDAALADLLSGGDKGWPSVPLSEAGMLTRGRRFVKSDYVESGLGCIHYGQIYTDYGASATRTVTYLPASFRDSMSLAHPGDVVIAGTSENVEDVGKAVAWLGGDDVAVHDDCFIFRHDLDPKFVSYFFASSLFQHQKRRFTSETKDSSASLPRTSRRSLCRCLLVTIRSAFQAWLMQWTRKSSPSALRQSVSVRHGEHCSRGCWTAPSTSSPPN